MMTKFSLFVVLLSHSGRKSFFTFFSSHLCCVLWFNIFISAGNVENVRSPGCGILEWDAPEGGVGELSYKIRFYSGRNYVSTPLSQRIVLSSPTNSLTFSEQDIPSGRPLFAIVSCYNNKKVLEIQVKHWYGSLLDVA